MVVLPKGFGEAFADDAPWVRDFIEECAAFPNGAHDDQVDAITQALVRWNMAPRETVIF